MHFKIKQFWYDMLFLFLHGAMKLIYVAVVE